MNIEKSELNHVELNYNIRFNGTGTTAHVKNPQKVHSTQVRSPISLVLQYYNKRGLRRNSLFVV